MRTFEEIRSAISEADTNEELTRVVEDIQASHEANDLLMADEDWAVLSRCIGDRLEQIYATRH